MGNEIPSGHGVRERILVEVTTIRQRYQAALESDGMFEWDSHEYWVDRIRRLVLLRAMAKRLGFEGLPTVPDDQFDEIELDGCRKSPTTAWEIIRMLAVFISGAGQPFPGSTTDFLNFAVAQPLVNPPFEPLFWLGLAWQMRPNSEERNLGEAIGGMAFDLSWYPASQSEGPQVRKAQVDWVKTVFDPQLDGTHWTRATEQDWAARCTELMHERRADANNVFFAVAHTAARLRNNPASA